MPHVSPEALTKLKAFYDSRQISILCPLFINPNNRVDIVETINARTKKPEVTCNGQSNLPIQCLACHILGKPIQI